ncbi:MAG: class I SAM-dependent methyltransferase [Gammaproteobacteria bacterium]|jgi:ubiquinone/menaquinone biosynthesis C-methylase UbiE|nr:class I SAM-dependent methyltransferase [Gammaproteobacteria bacterium]
MSKVLHAYQNDPQNYISQAKIPYDILADLVNESLGGLNGKVILDLGVGFQLIHGGLSLALALRDGAKQCFGIDIAHPDLHSADPAKIAFWKRASEELDIDVQGLDEGRLVFASTDILHFDDFFSKITLLQMSASEMWFKDNMFDIVISNAVFEHIQSPQAVVSELFRVLKPGGGAAISWNPFTGLRMGGHDIGMPYHYPWAHLRLNKKDHIAELCKVFSSKDLYNSAFPVEHTPTDERASVYKEDPELFRHQISYDLNKMRISELLEYANKAGFEVIQSHAHVFDEDRPALTQEILSELEGYTEDELLQTFHTLVVKKPL